jgi:hypothetical protein
VGKLGNCDTGDIFLTSLPQTTFNPMTQKPHIVHGVGGCRVHDTVLLFEEQIDWVVCLMRHELACLNNLVQLAQMVCVILTQGYHPGLLDCALSGLGFWIIVGSSTIRVID